MIATVAGTADPLSCCAACGATKGCVSWAHIGTAAEKNNGKYNCSLYGSVMSTTSRRNCNVGTMPWYTGPTFDFSYRVRVAAINPPSKNITIAAFPPSLGGHFTGSNAWLSPEARLTGSSWSPEYSFNSTGVTWAAHYSSVDYKIVLRRMGICLLGSCSVNLRTNQSVCIHLPVTPNRTMTVQVSVTLGGKTSLLEGTLLRGASGGGKIPRAFRHDCASLEIIIGRQISAATNFIETSRQYNARRYWPHFAALPQPDNVTVKRFPIQDRLVIGDSDIGAWRDGLRAMKQLGLRGVGGVPRAWLLSQELGYVLTPTAHESVALTDWQVDAPARGLPPGNLTAWAEHAVGEELAAGFARGELSTASLHDEPGCQLPSALPPVQNSTVAQRRWVAYLHASGLQPRDLGAAEWGGVLPNVTEGALAGASLAARRLRYWSIRYVAWDSSSYLASATHALEIASPGVGAYVNWSAFPCCTAQLIVCVRCYPNSDHYHRNVVA
jgi:hypothetical protein